MPEEEISGGIARLASDLSRLYRRFVGTERACLRSWALCISLRGPNDPESFQNAVELARASPFLVNLEGTGIGPVRARAVAEQLLVLPQLLHLNLSGKYSIDCNEEV